MNNFTMLGAIVLILLLFTQPSYAEEYVPPESGAPDVTTGAGTRLK